MHVFLFAKKPMTLFLLHRGPSFLNCCVCVVFLALHSSPLVSFICRLVLLLVLQEVLIPFWLCSLVLNFILMAFGSSEHELWHVFAYFWTCCLIQSFLVSAYRSFWASKCPLGFCFVCNYALNFLKSLHVGPSNAMWIPCGFLLALLSHLEACLGCT